MQPTEFAAAVREIEAVVGDKDPRVLKAKLLDADKSWQSAHVANVLETADAVLDNIDIPAVAAYFGVLVS